MAKPSLEIENLTADERLELIGQLWESLSKDPGGIPLTTAQRAELDQRLDEMEQDGGAGIPWQQVLDKIRAGR